jgi:hypothetical protein
VAVTTTGVGGLYVVDDLELGTYRVRLAADQGLTQTTPDPAEIAATRSITVRNVNFGVSTSQASAPPVVHHQPGRGHAFANRNAAITDAVLSGFAERHGHTPAV